MNKQTETYVSEITAIKPRKKSYSIVKIGAQRIKNLMIEYITENTLFFSGKSILDSSKEIHEKITHLICG